MKTLSRLSFLTIIILLGLAYILPLWKIILFAPQYPEGLEMQIHISNITGNLQTINNLNHYIGMKNIQPDSIAELKYMPYILGFLIFFGLLVVAFNKKVLLGIWFFMLAALGVTGLIDFYLWLYDYGHNLDPHAAIKIPGMTYQPPLFGTKQMLNFTTTSIPDSGGIILIGAGVFTFVILVYEVFKNKKDKTKTMFGKNKLVHVLLAILLIFATACSTEPVPINYGKDECVLCKMKIMDNRYGTEIVTDKGKVFVFDSVECLVDYYHSNADKQNSFKEIVVTDFSNPPGFTQAKKAFYLKSPHLPSPMGADLTAFAKKEDSENASKKFPGEILSWEKVLENLKK